MAIGRSSAGSLPNAVDADGRVPPIDGGGGVRQEAGIHPQNGRQLGDAAGPHDRIRRRSLAPGGEHRRRRGRVARRSYGHLVDKRPKPPPPWASAGAVRTAW